MYFENSIPYATADTHYFHHNIIRPAYCNRPFKNEGAMRQALITNYNKTVGPNDDCFFIGDVAMIGTSQWEKLKGILNKLNGNKHLILGNHDEVKPFRLQECGFKSVHTWLDVDVKMDDQVIKFRLSHDISQNYLYGIVPEDRIVLCGHSHNLFRIIPDKDVINVGVDVWDYYPISFKAAFIVLKRWKQRDRERNSDDVIRPDQEVS